MKNFNTKKIAEVIANSWIKDKMSGLSDEEILDRLPKPIKRR